MYIDDPIARALNLAPDPNFKPPTMEDLGFYEPFQQGNIPWNKGKSDLGGYKLSDTHKRNISTGRLRSTKCSPSPELRKQVSQKLKGRNDYIKHGSDNHNAKKILHVETGTVYGCIKDVCESFGISGLTVRRWCNAELEGRVIPRNKRTNGITLRYLTSD